MTYPVVRHRTALKDCREQDTQPPNKDVYTENPDGGLEPFSRVKDAAVESENGGFDKGHCAGVQDL